MKHIWVNIKNSEKGGNKPIERYRDDLEQALVDFEVSQGLQVDSTVRAALGARGSALTTKKDRVYTHPVPHLSNHGSYIFGNISVPADIEDGKSDFTNVLFLATQDYLLTVLTDPSWVFNARFGEAVLNIHQQHEQRGIEPLVSNTLIRLIGVCVASLDHSLDSLNHRFRRFKEKIELINASDGRKLEQEVDKRYSSVQDLDIEVNSLSTVIEQLELMLRHIEDQKIMMSGEESGLAFFNEAARKSANGLRVEALHLISYHRALVFDCATLIKKMDRLQEKALTLATHRITAFGAAILIPNLLYDFFGQSFDSGQELPQVVRDHGWTISIALTVSYWIIQYLWFKRKRYI